MAAFKFSGVKVVEAPKNAFPKCPACDAELRTIWVKTKGLGIVEQKQVILCPHCRVFLGYGTFAY